MAAPGKPAPVTWPVRLVAVALALTAVLAGIGARVGGEGAALASACGSCLALAAQLAAIALLRPAMGAPAPRFMGRWAAGMAVRGASLLLCRADGAAASRVPGGLDGGRIPRCAVAVALSGDALPQMMQAPGHRRDDLRAYRGRARPRAAVRGARGVAAVGAGPRRPGDGGPLADQARRLPPPRGLPGVAHDVARGAGAGAPADAGERRAEGWRAIEAMVSSSATTWPSRTSGTTGRSSHPTS